MEYRKNGTLRGVSGECQARGPAAGLQRRGSSAWLGGHHTGSWAKANVPRHWAVARGNGHPSAVRGPRAAAPKPWAAAQPTANTAALHRVSQATACDLWLPAPLHPARPHPLPARICRAPWQILNACAGMCKDIRSKRHRRCGAWQDPSLRKRCKRKASVAYRCCTQVQAKPLLRTAVRWSPNQVNPLLPKARIHGVNGAWRR